MQWLNDWLNADVAGPFLMKRGATLRHLPGAPGHTVCGNKVTDRWRAVTQQTPRNKVCARCEHYG